VFQPWWSTHRNRPLLEDQLKDGACCTWEVSAASWRSWRWYVVCTFSCCVVLARICGYCNHIVLMIYGYRKSIINQTANQVYCEHHSPIEVHTKPKSQWRRHTRGVGCVHTPSGKYAIRKNGKHTLWSIWFSRKLVKLVPPDVRF